MSDDADELKTKGLDALLKALKNELPRVRVGILGKGNAREGGGPSNAFIGAMHEFGTTVLPVRSFLRVPITEHLEKEMKAAGAFTKETAVAVIKAGTMVPWLKKIGVLAEGIVQKAFASSGFGAWPPSDMTRKKVHMTLIESQQLRNSITSDVKG